MEKLMRELELLRAEQDVTNAKLVGALIATAARCKDILDARIVGLEALAIATAMQRGIDAARLHDDFLRILQSHYESAAHVPPELKDIAAAIQLASTER